MRKILKAIIVPFLTFASRVVLRRYQPKIVMVTGSVGKTSTKDAVAAALSSRFYLRASAKSFNSEYGVPFTIMGATGDPGRDPLAWLQIFKAALGLLLLPNHYPRLLVLEVSAEKPGDLAHILDIATPNVVVVTGLTQIPVHVEAYEGPEAVREEEFSPALSLLPGAPLIVPTDDPYALDLAEKTEAHILTYGTASAASVYASEFGFHEEEGRIVGMHMTVRTGKEEVRVVVRGSVGKIQTYPVTAALAAALALEVPIAEAAKAVEGEYIPPPGRGRLFDGKNGSLLIDDSYNASPAAVEAALRNLGDFPNAKRRIAVLGDMLELGRYSVQEHERIGALAREVADVVFAVGIRARAFQREEGKVEVRLFDTSVAAAEALKDFVQEGDVVLVKGSQSIRMERVVEVLLKNSEDQPRLVRQDRAWKRR